MPHVYKRPNSPFWYAALQDPRARRGVVRRSTGCKRKSEATEIAAKLQAEVNAEVAEAKRRLSHGQSGLKWSEALEILLEHGELRESTKRGYVSIAVTVIRTLGDFHLRQIDVDAVRQYVNTRRRECVALRNHDISKPRSRVTDATIKRELSCMSSVYKFAMEHQIEGCPTENPFAQFDRSFLRESKPIDRHLRPAQFEDLLAACPNPVTRRILIVLAGTGMRASELTGLMWGEVDLKSRVIEFGNLDAHRTKTSKSRRIPILRPVYDALVEQVKSQGFADPHTPFARKPDPLALVFPSPQRGRRRYSLTHMARGAKLQAGLKSFRIHDLRHTLASWLLQKGVDPFAIASVLGHATVSTTKRYARHIADSVADQIREIDLPLTAQSDAQSDGAQTAGTADIAKTRGKSKG